MQKSLLEWLNSEKIDELKESGLLNIMVMADTMQPKFPPVVHEFMIEGNTPRLPCLGSAQFAL